MLGTIKRVDNMKVINMERMDLENKISLEVPDDANLSGGNGSYKGKDNHEYLMLFLLNDEQFKNAVKNIDGSSENIFTNFPSRENERIDFSQELPKGSFAWKSFILNLTLYNVIITNPYCENQSFFGKLFRKNDQNINRKSIDIKGLKISSPYKNITFHIANSVSFK